MFIILRLLNLVCTSYLSHTVQAVNDTICLNEYLLGMLNSRNLILHQPRTHSYLLLNSFSSPYHSLTSLPFPSFSLVIPLSFPPSYSLAIPFPFPFPFHSPVCMMQSTEKSRRASSLLLGNDEYNDFNDNEKGSYSPQQPMHDFG
jgi:hypothetical protein